VPSIDVEVEIYCGGCGAGLCNQSEPGRTRGRGQNFITVNPCDKCIEQAKKEAHSEGYDAGYADKEKEL